MKTRETTMKNDEKIEKQQWKMMKKREKNNGTWWKRENTMKNDEQIQKHQWKMMKHRETAMKNDET